MHGAISMIIEEDWYCQLASGLHDSNHVTAHIYVYRDDPEDASEELGRIYDYLMATVGWSVRESKLYCPLCRCV